MSRILTTDELLDMLRQPHILAQPSKVTIKVDGGVAGNIGHLLDRFIKLSERLRPEPVEGRKETP